MAKKQTIKMPLEYVEKTLNYLGLDNVEKVLSDGTQLLLTKDGFSHVNVNVYETGSIVVDPEKVL